MNLSGRCGGGSEFEFLSNSGKEIPSEKLKNTKTEKRFKKIMSQPNETSVTGDKVAVKPTASKLTASQR